MAQIGFSTGALAKDDFRRAVATAREAGAKALELSALRTSELPALEDFANDADLSDFSFVAVHAPADFSAEQEPDVIDRLRRITKDHNWPIVIHPDRIVNYDLWRPFGSQLCIENMDRRKSVGRYAMDLGALFDILPDAKFCLDVAHARQIDPSMTECFRMLQSFRNRLCHLHLSGVATSSKHEALSFVFLYAFRRLAESLPENIPVVLETPVNPANARAQVTQTEQMFGAGKKDQAETDEVGLA